MDGLFEFEPTVILKSCFEIFGGDTPPLNQWRNYLRYEGDGTMVENIQTLIKRIKSIFLSNRSLLVYKPFSIYSYFHGIYSYYICLAKLFHGIGSCVTVKLYSFKFQL